MFINQDDVRKEAGVSLKVEKKKDKDNVYTVSVHLDEVAKQHEGEMVFVVNNKKGTDTCALQLNVEGEWSYVVG